MVSPSSRSDKSWARRFLISRSVGAIVAVIVEVTPKLDRNALDVKSIAEFAAKRIQTMKDSDDSKGLLGCYDNKGLLAIASHHLRSSKKDAFVEWFTRMLLSGKAPGLVDAVRNALPKVLPE